MKLSTCGWWATPASPTPSRAARHAIDRGQSVIFNQGVLGEAAVAELADIGDELRGAELEQVDGDPDGRDEGGRYVLIRSGGGYPLRSTYSASRAPDPLVRADEFVADVIRSLAHCTPSERVMVTVDCTPRP